MTRKTRTKTLERYQFLLCFLTNNSFISLCIPFTFQTLFTIHPSHVCIVYNLPRKVSINNYCHKKRFDLNREIEHFWIKFPLFSRNLRVLETFTNWVPCQVTFTFVHIQWPCNYIGAKCNVLKFKCKILLKRHYMR